MVPRRARRGLARSQNWQPPQEDCKGPRTRSVHDKLLSYAVLRLLQSFSQKELFRLHSSPLRRSHGLQPSSVCWSSRRPQDPLVTVQGCQEARMHPSLSHDRAEPARSELQWQRSENTQLAKFPSCQMPNSQPSLDLQEWEGT